MVEYIKNILDDLPYGFKCVSIVIILMFFIVKLFTIEHYSIDVDVDSRAKKINGIDTIVFELNVNLYQYTGPKLADGIWYYSKVIPYDSIDVVTERQVAKAKAFKEMHKKITK